MFIVHSLVRGSAYRAIRPVALGVGKMPHPIFLLIKKSTDLKIFYRLPRCGIGDRSCQSSTPRHNDPYIVRASSNAFHYTPAMSVMA